ncbi:MAG TPA: hypothetical protein VHV53_03200 [Solirubrobacterales bacterium]|nr:hypothetical protein [Solirubrobacterales bacterium]
MSGGSGRPGMIGWSALRPVFVGMMLVFDAGVVLALGIGRHKGWLAPFIGFGIVLLGFIWLMGWSVRHRHDDDHAS